MIVSFASKDSTCKTNTLYFFPSVKVVELYSHERGSLLLTFYDSQGSHEGVLTHLHIPWYKLNVTKLYYFIIYYFF
jgi:hypothetical protein